MKQICCLLLLTTLFIGCKKKALTNSCCNNPAINESFAGGYIAVPNIFTPDNDGKNDTFVPIVQNVLSYTLEITSTKGIIFSDNTGMGWDGMDDKGKRVKDVAGWTIYLKTNSNEDLTFRGQVCVLTEGDNICPLNNDKCIYGNQFRTSINDFDLDQASNEMLCTE